MEIEELNKDITLFYVEASSFPEGILAAHEKLHAIVPFSKERNYFGVSRPEQGVIRYKAAVEDLSEGEVKKFGCPTLVVKKGKYICETVQDYMKYANAIGYTFQKMLSRPDLDPEGYCVEWYIDNREVKCMIRLNSET